jgi:hypothetical protein
VFHPPLTQITHCPCMRQISMHHLQKPYYVCTDSAVILCRSCNFSRT